MRKYRNEWERLRDDIAAQVVDHQHESKDMTFILDCIYDYEYYEIEPLRKALKKLRKTARELHGVNVTIIAVAHLDDNGKVNGSKKLKNEAVMWFSLKRFSGKEEEKKRTKTAEKDRENELLSEVTLSWAGRYSEAGQLICIAQGEKEGFPGNMHYEVKPLEWKEAKNDPELAERVMTLAQTQGELYEQSKGIKIDSKGLKYVAERLLIETGVVVNPETIRTWLNKKES